MAPIRPAPGPALPLPSGSAPKVETRWVVRLRRASAIIDVIGNGRRWTDAPVGHGPPKTRRDRFIRWSRSGVFGRGQARRPEAHRQPPRSMRPWYFSANRAAAAVVF